MNLLAVHNHPHFVPNLVEAINYSTSHHSLIRSVEIIQSHTLAETLTLSAGDQPVSLILISMDLAKNESSAWMTAIRSHRPDVPILFVSDLADHETVGKVIAQESVSCPFDTRSGRLVLNAILTGVSRNLEQNIRTSAPGDTNTQANLTTPENCVAASTARTDTTVDTRKATNSAKSIASIESAGKVTTAHGQSPLCELESRLTPRQWQVLCLLRDGHSNKRIARILNLAEGTVKIHCLAIYRVLGVSNRTQAAMQANQVCVQTA